MVVVVIFTVAQLNFSVIRVTDNTHQSLAIQLLIYMSVIESEEERTEVSNNNVM
jgi:hypothetical protein